jgi:hypothetical protein
MKKIIGLFLVLLLAPLALKADNTSPQITWRASTFYSVTTPTTGVQNISLTYTAQCPYCKILVTVGNAYGGTGMLWYDITTSPAAPVGVTTLASLSLASGNWSPVWGAYAPGHWIHLFASTATVTAFLRFESVP